MFQAAVENAQSRWVQAQLDDFKRLTDKSRKMVIARYLAASLPSPDLQALMRTAYPNTLEFIKQMAAECGAKEEWCLMALLVVSGFHCSNARVWLRENYQIPPILWVILCIDSGTNKSSLITFLNRVYTHVEDTWTDKPNLNCTLDEWSLPAMGKELSKSNRYRGILIMDEVKRLLRQLKAGGEVFSPGSFAKLFGAMSWKRSVGGRHCLCIVLVVAPLRMSARASFLRTRKAVQDEPHLSGNHRCSTRRRPGGILRHGGGSSG